MSKIKITDLTNDSSLVDLSLDEAAKVNGGYSGWSPNLYNDFLYGSLGSDSFSAYNLSQNRNRYTPEATLANGVNSNSFATFDRRVTGILNPLYGNGIRF